jgi:membrane protease YdiL (CAAX protease family)
LGVSIAMQLFDARWFVISILLVISIRPLNALDGSLGVWLSQLALELALGAAALTTVGRVEWRTAFERLGWVRSRLSRSQQRRAIVVSFLLVVAAGILLAEDPQTVAGESSPAVPVGPAALFLSVVLFPVFFEELYFRGAVLPLLTRRFGAVVGVVASSVLFGLLHAGAGLNTVVFAVTLGLCLGTLTHQSGSIHEAVIIHGLNNGVYFVSQLG